MLNVSQMSSNANPDNKYKNITILSRPMATSAPVPSPTASSPSSSSQALKTNSSGRTPPQTPKQLNRLQIESPSPVSSSLSASVGSLSTGSGASPMSSGYSSLQSQSSLVSPSVPPMSALSAPLHDSNGSTSLRSTVLANNTNSNCSNNCNNNNNNNNMNNSNNSKSNSINSSDKSPMCRINEISRYNDIKHEYHLIEEFGPPHDKTFIVALKLGQTEEYRGSGPSIKKAQRTAAALALQQTKLKQPAPRVPKHIDKSVWPLTPTVELNVLAMKLGQNAVYHVYEPPRPQPPTYSFGPIGSTAGTAVNAYDFRGMHYQRYHVPRGPYSASLTVGTRHFVGKGRTAQAARHAAAEEALKVIRELALASNQSTHTETASAEESGDTGTGTGTAIGTETIPSANSGDDYIKSPISLVHEMALKRNLSVKFEVVEESGPSHMPQFVTQCSVGDVVTRGEGTNKKVSKKYAAIRMMEELQKLEPLPTVDHNDENSRDEDPSASAPAGSGSGSGMGQRSGRSGRKAFKFNNKKKRNNNKNIIKDNSNPNSNSSKGFDDKNIANESISNDINTKSNNSFNNSNNSNLNNLSVSDNCEELDPELTFNGLVTSDGIDVNTGAPIHPINRLIQLQQARKEKEPQFTLLSERCTDRRRREFTIECTIHVTKGPNAPQVVSAVGLGPNKKLAKKNAADAMLQVLGYSSSRPQPQSILKQDSTEGQGSHKKIRQVKFVEENGTGTCSGARSSQLVDMTCGHVVHSTPKLGRQLVPGLILMPTEANISDCRLKSTDCTNTGLTGLTDSSHTNSMIYSSDLNPNSKSNNIENISAKVKSVSSIAKEFLNSKLSAISMKEISAELSANGDQPADQLATHVEQLSSLAEAVGAHQFQVHFSDFPKKHSNNRLEYLSVVTITTVWNQRPIVSHGSGQTQDEARNQASHQALIALSQLDSTQYS